jgi:hypothetical protein
VGQARQPQFQSSAQQSQQFQPINKSTDNKNNQKNSQDGVPKDWLEPRIYKGTSV